METMEVTSMPVPFAQEIAKEALTIVPERYIRPQLERPTLSTTTPLPQIPVIDLSKLLSQDHKGPETGEPSLCLQRVRFLSGEHFIGGKRENPIEEKKKFGQREGDVEEYGQALVSDEQKLDSAKFYMFTLPPQNRKPHLLSFRVDLEVYCEELRNLAKQILDLMSNSLAIDPKEIRKAFGEAEQSMRMNYYPPCPQPELVIGLNSHSDGSGLTILLQDNEVEGLQIKKDGLWIPVKPLPNAFTINLGDMLEVMTNGIYQSIEHRAIVNSKKERLSIATFFTPSMNAIISPAPSPVTPRTPLMFKAMTARAYLKGYFSKELRGKSFLDSIRIHAEN